MLKVDPTYKLRKGVREIISLQTAKDALFTCVDQDCENIIFKFLGSTIKLNKPRKKHWTELSRMGVKVTNRLLLSHIKILAFKIFNLKKDNKICKDLKSENISQFLLTLEQGRGVNKRVLCAILALLREELMKTKDIKDRY